jgi:putative endonuclease
MPNLRALGASAENRAADFLLSKGYTIVTRRFTTRKGEIDIVALDGDELVFVEVKLRMAPGYSPEEAVGPKKLKSLRAAADAYLSEFGSLDQSHRFDLVAIDQGGVRHHERAF